MSARTLPSQPTDNSPFEVIADSADRERWLAARRTPKTVGASEVPAVLGISPFTSAYHLACVKTGRIPEDDLSDNERVFWGTQLEEAIAHGYSARTNRPVVMFGLTLRSLRYPWLTATPDAFTSETADDAADLADCIAELRRNHRHDVAINSLAEALANGGWHPLQIKNIGFGSAEHWSQGVPDYYEAQCRTEAIVCGTGACTGAALVAGQQLIWDDVPRTEIADRQIVNLTQAFVRDCQAGRLPPPDGSASTKAAIVAQWPRDRPESNVTLGAEWLELADEYARLKAETKAAETRIDEIENALKAEIKDASLALLPDGSGWSYRLQKRAARTVPALEFRVLRRTKAKGDQL